VVISYLSPMGIGYQKGLKRGDTVKSLNGRPVGSLVDFTRTFRKDGSEIKSVEIIRDEKHFTVGFLPDNE
jgi:S1-C subfamily serine protease